MLAKIFSSTVCGIGSLPVEIEVVSVNGLPQFSIVGLAGTEVKEAKERVYAAIKSSGFKFPQTKKIVNLSPADMPKVGTCYDLGIAYGLLVASKGVDHNALASTMILGELSLDGAVKGVSGVLPAVVMAKEEGFLRVIVPLENLKEANLVDGIEICGVGSLKDLVNGDFVRHSEQSERNAPAGGGGLGFGDKADSVRCDMDFAEIKGQHFAKRALEVAAAGGHNVCFSGPPGSGKTLLGRAFTGILPPLSRAEALEVAKIYSVGRLLDRDKPLNFERPFRTVHHTASAVSIIGGGRLGLPGEITLAHRGVLFFDELPEFPRHVIESLRQPLEDRSITITRAAARFTYPADFIFMASMNPCPCGYFGDTKKACKCSGSEIARYGKRVSGPLLDRIDMIINVPRVETHKLIGVSEEESSKTVRARVERAVKIQERRFIVHDMLSNSQMGPRQIAAYCPLTDSQREFLKHAIDAHALSARSYYRVLKLARTIADLALSDAVRDEHLMEALRFKVRES